jgi:glycosyltransferase involved in cell wall biosynthesis
MMGVTERLFDSGSWGEAEPELSVLIPFHRDDPRPLLASLERQAAALGGAVELVVLDDGSPDRAVAAAAARTVAALRAPARMVSLSVNVGRARGRNRLARHARGRHLLFLDSDMAPDALDFLRRWLQAAREDLAVTFGGITVERAPTTPQTVLHQALSRRSDCLPAAQRARAPEKHVFTSNLLIRRDVFALERFDEGFTGWGWEDVEWAMRVSRRWPIAHIDNTATHLGLDTAEALIGKYEQSAANFARVVQAHPEIVSRYAGFRAARRLRALPFRAFWRPMLKRVAVAAAAPISLRVLFTRLYRAALYAEVV